MKYRYFDEKKYTPTEDVEIWRYMPITHLISLLETSSLYFAPLSSFIDPYEGTLPIYTFNNLWMDAQQNYTSTSLLLNKYVKSYTASCWHESTHESEALWRLYSSNGPCVAIRSSYKKIMEQMPENVVGVRIKYIDFSEEGVGNFITNDKNKEFQLSPLELVSIKRKSFEHEKEIRFFIPKHQLELKVFEIPPEMIVESPHGKVIAQGAKPGSAEQIFRDRLSTITEGVPLNHRGDSLTISLNNTLSGIIVSPFMRDWEAASIEKMISKYNISAQIEHSKLLRPHKYN